MFGQLNINPKFSNWTWWFRCTGLLCSSNRKLARNGYVQIRCIDVCRRVAIRICLYANAHTFKLHESTWVYPFSLMRMSVECLYRDLSACHSEWNSFQFNGIYRFMGWSYAMSSMLKQIIWSCITRCGYVRPQWNECLLNDSTRSMI